jgi:cytidine deaminase
MICKDYKDLTPEEQQLVDACWEAQKLSYAPYSNFSVGCSILMSNGSIMKGANQENASYPLCLCAERVALSYAAMHHPTERIKAIAISTSADLQVDQKPAAPCGACRQVLFEYKKRQEKDFDIILVGKDNYCWVYPSIHELLPHTFDGDLL